MSEGFFDFYEQRNEEKGIDEALFAALDLETTGLYPELDAIVEIGIITFRNWSVTDTFHSLVDPGRIIPGEAVRIHGINEDMVAGKPRIEDLFADIKKFLGEAVIIAHNAPFDLGFLEAAARKIGEEYTPPVAIDTCELARKVFPGLPSYSLQNLAARFTIESPAAHRAVDDARICLRLFEIECEKLEGKDLTAADLAVMTKK